MDTDDVRDSGDEQDEQDEQDEAAKAPEASNSEKQPEKLRVNASRNSLNQGRNKSRSITPQSSTRSQSHPPLKRNWRSANAFINFVQDFKKDCPDTVTGGNIFQVCGERWKVMTDEQKQPYIDAAQTVKRLKQRKCMDSTDQTQRKSITRVTKKKPESKRNETSQKKSKANKPDPKSNSDTDTATTTVHSSMSDADSF